MIEEKAYGKINLALRIVNKRPDGYHDIDTVFQSIELHDTVFLSEGEGGLQLSCSEASLPCDRTNLAYQAAKALWDYRGIRESVHIHLEKRIPVAAGLAGGSADCAAVLRGLNRLWQLHLSVEELRCIGASLGADVPFCVTGGTCRGTGRGELLSFLPGLPSWELLIIHPHIAVHTGQAYSLFDERPVCCAIDVDAMVQAAAEKNFDGVQSVLGNTFEELILPDYKEICHYKTVLHEQGLVPLMSGSGPTVFALVPPWRDAEAIYAVLQGESRDADCILTALI